jgi:MFS family permease
MGQICSQRRQTFGVKSARSPLEFSVSVWRKRCTFNGSSTFLGMLALPRTTTLESLSQRYGSRYKWLVLLVVGVGMVAGVLSTSSFNVAVPALTRHFGLGQDQVQWSVTGFMAAMTVAMLPTPWLLERFGFRQVFLLSLMVLTAASVAGFLVPTFSLVVTARIVQGLAAGVLQPLGPLALMRLFPPRAKVGPWG